MFVWLMQFECARESWQIHKARQVVKSTTSTRSLGYWSRLKNVFKKATTQHFSCQSSRSHEPNSVETTSLVGFQLTWPQCNRSSCLKLKTIHYVAHDVLITSFQNNTFSFHSSVLTCNRVNLLFNGENTRWMFS